MLRGLLARAEQGQITGVMFVAAVTTGKDQIGMAGDFAEDLDYAQQAAAGGFTTLTGLKKSIAAKRPLPRSLKGSK